MRRYVVYRGSSMGVRTLYKALLLFAMCFLLASCGEKGQQEETDDYVYVARQVSVPAKDQYGNQRVKDLKTANGYLYYLYDDFDYNFSVKTKQYGIRKIALDGEVNLADSELVVGADDLMKYGTDNEFPMSDPLIKAYAVDHEQRVYLFIYNREIWGEAENGILVSKTTEGEGDFALILPTAFAVDGDMLVVNEEYIAVLLPGSIICLIDKSGNIIGNIPVKSSLLELESEYGWKEQLLLGEEGKIYYSIEARYQWKKEVYEVIVNEKKLKKVESLSGQYSSERYFVLYGSSQGLIYAETNMSNSCGNGTLYLYNEKEDSFEELLHWADSNMQEDILMDNVLWVDEDIMVACRFRNGSHFTGTSEEGLYVLRKTAVKDIPQKEEVVIACNEPSASLLNCVAEFNRSNDTYHINVKMYQGDGWNNRFDSSLVSSEPPDLLDLSFMDIEKYARKGTLADLAPYLDKSDVLDRENYLENALEGYTYNGSLVCIPKEFNFYEILGRASQIDSSKAWDIKAVMELTEKYPDCRLLNWGYISISTYYMLEHFIDWEEGTCSLDGEEFREFVQWMVKYDTNAPLVHDEYAFVSSLSDDILLGYYPMFCIRDYIANRAKMEGQGVSVGYPTEDGKGTYQVNVQTALCMTTDSQHKEGAWAFLEYYLTREGAEGIEDMAFPTRRDLLFKSIQEAATKREKVVEVDGKIITPLDMNGEPVLERKFTYSLNGEIFDCYYITEEQAEELLGMIEALDFKPRGGSKEEALQIIREELSDYQGGNKSLEEVTGIIQSRVALLLSE